MTRHQLSREQIKAIADRAEGKEPEVTLRTFVCKDCNHEVVVKPTTPKYETPTVCGQCWEKRLEATLHEEKKRERPITPEQALKMMELGVEVLNQLKRLDEKKDD
jgi:DNA replicative helicase MCM subunit Mcm2 (Cdc46/Mcm family)